MSNGSVNFDLQLAIKGFQSSLDQAKSSVGSFTNDTKNRFKESENATNKLADSFSGNLTGSLNLAGGALGTLGVAMFAANIATGLLQSGVSLITNTINGSVDAYAGSEEALNKLAQSMRLTGTFSSEASAQVEEFATKLEASSKFSDDAIISQVAYARSLGLSTFQAEQLVQAAANMSATLGGGLEENVAKLGMTLDGTATRLGKLIPGLKSLTEEQLKAGAAADYINSKFIGAAANDLNTHAGKVAYLKNQYDNLQEAIGGLIVNNGAYQTSMGSISNIVASTTKFITDHTVQIKNLFTALGITAGIIGTVAAGYGLFTVAMGIYTAGLVTTTVTTAAYTGATAVATTATWSLNAALAANPAVLIIGAVVAGVALLGYGIYKLVEYWDEVKVAAAKSLRFMLTGLLEVQTLLTATFGDNFGIEKTKGAIDSLSTSIDELNKKIAAKPKDGDADKEAAKKAQASKDDALAKELTAEKQANQALLVERKSMLEQKAALTLQGQQSLAELESAAANERINSEIANNEESLATKQAAYQLQLETRIAQEAEELVRRQELQIAELDEIYNHELAKAALLTNAAERKKAIEEANNKEAIARVTLTNKQQIEALTLSNKSQKALDDKSAADKKATTALKTQMEESYLNSAQGFIAAGAALAKAGSREAKALAITDATIATYLGATKAFASVPYPANFIAAGSVIAGGLANVAKITSAGSFANGGFIGGSSFSGDKLQANVNSGEAVLNVSQQKEFMKIANGESKNGSLLDAIHSLGDRIMSMEIKLIADDNEIARSASRGFQNGVVMGSSR